MIFGAILAGGVGSRMHMADMPKQFLPLGNKPIIIHTLEKFLTCSRFDQIYIGTHSDWVNYTEDLVAKYVPHARDRIRVVCGGENRNETIQNIITALEADYGSDDDHVIVTHDAVRPFVTLRMIEENIDQALRCGAVDTVTPAVDTIVVSGDGKTIRDIPDRKQMYQGQTPQSFRVRLLRRVHAHAEVLRPAAAGAVSIPDGGGEGRADGRLQDLRGPQLSGLSGGGLLHQSEDHYPRRL